jgi:hypothetical protein
VSRSTQSRRRICSKVRDRDEQRSSQDPVEGNGPRADRHSRQGAHEGPTTARTGAFVSRQRPALGEVNRRSISSGSATWARLGAVLWAGAGSHSGRSRRARELLSCCCLRRWPQNMAPGEPPRGRFLGPSSFTANAFSTAVRRSGSRLPQMPGRSEREIPHEGVSRRRDDRAAVVISSTVTGVPRVEACLLASVKSIAQRHFAQRSV